MSTRYLPLLKTVQANLAAINPDRIVTRSWQDFGERPQEDLHRGVWMLRAHGIGSYPYETSDGQFATDSMRATENGRLQFQIVGQLLLQGDDLVGEDVDDAEFQLISELEQLADAAIEDETVCALKLLRVVMSGQVEMPYAWVVSTWEVFAL